MKRRGASFASLIAGACAACALHAQQAPRVARVGWLCQVQCPPPKSDEFVPALRALGWVEGTNLQVDRRSAGGDAKRLASMAAELVASKPDLIFAVAPAASIAARKATSSIPIVFMAVANPMKIGLVTSLARPGGNATGLATIPGNIVGKQFELLKEILPSSTRAALLVNPDNAMHRVYVENDVTGDAEAMRLQIRVYEARSADAIEPAIAEALRGRAELLVQLGDSVLNQHIPQLALRAQLPSAYLWAGQAEAGGLISYGPDVHYMIRRAAEYADRILKGVRPADLPVEQPTKLELVVNLRTAKALGLKIPQSILVRADRVIE